MRHRFKRASRLSRRAGGFTRVLERHTLIHFPRSDTLVVTFDNMKSRDMPAPAYPWGYEFLAKQGYSHLGVMMSRRNDWWRRPDLDACFTELRDDGFFSGFKKVIFYGSSMGGYGALAFAPAAPGCRVVAFSPQTSLDPDIVPFENRYGPGYARGLWDKSGFHDGAEGAKAAGQVIVFADPWQREDAAHVARLQTDNLVWAKCPFFGHDVARLMMFANILTPAITEAFAGTLTEARFCALRREGRGAQSLARSVLQKAIHRGHNKLALDSIEAMRSSRPEWKFPRLRWLAEAALKEPHLTESA